MKNSIFAVGEYFDDHEDFDRHWLAFFTQLETRHNTTDRPEEPHGLLQSLLDSLSRQQPAALVPYDESHMAETTESILPARQRNVEASDRVVVGKAGKNSQHADPETYSYRGNPLFELKVGDLSVFIAGERVVQPTKGPTRAPRPCWMALCLNIDLEKEMGLFQWFKTKTVTAKWTTSGWIVDNDHKYGVGKGEAPDGTVGEWMPLSNSIYWGFNLQETPVSNPTHKIFLHDAKEIKAIMQERKVADWNAE